MCIDNDTANADYVAACAKATGCGTTKSGVTYEWKSSGGDTDKANLKCTVRTAAQTGLTCAAGGAPCNTATALTCTSSGGVPAGNS